jgi:hypothetical protein
MTLSRSPTAAVTGAFLVLTLAACARTVPVADGPGMRLPAPPAFMAPVPVQQLRADQDARDALARDRAALKQANARLRKSKAWYLSLRRGAAGR